MFPTSMYVDVVDIGLIWNRAGEGGRAGGIKEEEEVEEEEREGFLSNNC